MPSRQERRQKHREELAALFKEYRNVLLNALGEDSSKIDKAVWDVACETLKGYVAEKIKLCPQRKSVYTEALILTCDAVCKSIDSVIKFTE